MKLGLVSAILPKTTLEEVMAITAEIGYNCVEVTCWPTGKAERRYAGVTHIDADCLNENDIKHIKELQVDSGVEISALGYYPNP